MIKVKNLCKKYNSTSGEVRALDNVNLELGEKGFVFILGKSGCGKTTLLNMLGGLDSADGGSIKTDFILDKNKEKTDILKFSDKEMDLYHNVYLGFVFQNYCLIDNWNVKENIAITLQQQVENASHSIIDEKIKNVLEYVGLNNMELRKPGELSGGQAQRVAIARALVKEPRVILADEPTGNLDSKSSERIFELLKKISNNCLVVVVTHDEQSALKYADRIIKMKDGSVVDDINNGSKNQEYRVLLKNVNTNAEETLISKSLKQVREFICDKIISDKSDKKVLVDVQFTEKEENEFESSAIKKDVTTKNISAKTIFRLALNNLKIRKTRLIITMLIFSLTLMFLQVISEVSFSNYNKSVSQYLVNNGIEKIYLKEDISYKDDFYEECIVTRTNTEKITQLVNKYWINKNYYSTISEVELSKDNNQIAVLMNDNAEEIVLISGNKPVRENDICITDYIMWQFGLNSNCVGEKLLIYGQEFNICGVVETDYQKRDIIKKMSNNGITPYDEYLIRKEYLKCICSEGFSEYLEGKIDNILLDASNFTRESVQSYLNSELSYSYVGVINEEYKPLYGRMPKGENEVLVSYDFAIENSLIDKQNKFTEQEFSYLDIYDEKYNGAYLGKINMYDILGKISIVGVVDTNETMSADVWIDDNVYNKLKTDYFDIQLYDSFELMLTDMDYDKLVETVNNMRITDVFIDEPNVEKIYNTYEGRNNLLTIGIILTLIFLIITLLLNVSFVSYSVSDNHNKIGILRALGVNKNAISKIFVIEAMTIAIFSFVVSFIFAMIVFVNINQKLGAGLECEIIFFYRNPVIATSIFVASIILGVICVILPVLSMTKEKVINLIKGMK